MVNPRDIAGERKKKKKKKKKVMSHTKGVICKGDFLRLKKTVVAVAHACVFVFFPPVDIFPSTRRVYVREGPDWTSVGVATLRLESQMKLAISPSHSTQTPGESAPALTP